MKNIFLPAIFFLVTSSLTAQKQVRAEKTIEEYKRSATAYNTVGAIFLGGGTTAFIIGLHMSARASKKPDANGLAVTGLGLLSGIASIPFFIAGDRNSKMAKKLQLRSQTLMLPQNGGWMAKQQPTLSFVVRI